MEQFLQDFQQKLQDCEDHYNIECPEEEPYKEKYIGRDKLEDLLKTEILKIDSNESKICKAIIYSFLGKNYAACEENTKSQQFYQNSFDLFKQIDNIDYQHYQIDNLNNIGFINVNYEKCDIGLEHLLQANQMIEQLKDYKYEKIYNNKPIEGCDFRPYFEGGNQYDRIQELQTLTLFYMAQTYTKLGQKENAAYYCGLTLKRQYDFKKFQLKDWCVNCISLCEYYCGKYNFSQAYYLVNSAMNEVPIGKKKKLRATIQMCQGKMFSSMLQANVNSLIKEQDIQFIDEKKTVFENNVEWITFKKATTMEEIKQNFRFSNTQYKKSLEIFIIDGYVTEHIQIIEDLSQMYFNLALGEKDPKQQILLNERRRDLLSPILKDLNQGAFKDTYERILVQLSQIYLDLFDLCFQVNCIDSQKQPKPAKIKEMNNHSRQAIICYEQIISCLLKDKESQKDNMVDFHHSMINAKFNIAKVLSRTYQHDIREKIKTLQESQQLYQSVVEYIERDAQNGEPFKQQKAMCKEMSNMIVVKINNFMKQLQ